MHGLPLRLAARALLVGGFLMGIVTVGPQAAGCGSAFGGGDALEGSVEVVAACSSAVSARQDVVGVLLTSGVAVLGLSFARPRSSGA